MELQLRLGHIHLATQVGDDLASTHVVNGELIKHQEDLGA
jgi:hypothetical protein